MISARAELALPLVFVLGCIEDKPSAVLEVCEPDAGALCSRIHRPGILDSTNEDFHGALLARLAYDFETCRRCHGQGFEGGASRASCLSCHPRGPTDCVTCHARITEQGAHRAHLPRAPVEHFDACHACHEVPSSVSVKGHVLVASGMLDPPPAEVRFAPEGPASTSMSAGTYEPTTQTCAGVPCHGGRLEASGSRDPTPSWRGPVGALGCERCHGMPPPRPYHPDAECSRCHPRVVDAKGAIFDPTLHRDGRIDIGHDGQGLCTGCHETASLDRSHDAHLDGARRLSAPLDCGDCHVVPSAVVAQGHIDTPLPAEVFPEGHTGLAYAWGARPRWDGRACSGTYCHGSSTVVPWGLAVDAVFCGSCHEIPPPTPAHASVSGLRDCAGCHAGTVDADGNIRWERTATGTSSLHLDGKVDVE